MKKQKYIITLVETSTNKAFSTLFGTKNIIFFILAVLLSLAIISYPIQRIIQNVEYNIHLSNLRQENQLLKEALISWDNRMNMVESNIKEIYQRNEHIREIVVQANVNTGYGVGGPSYLSRVNLLNKPEVNQRAEQLQILESRVSSMHTAVRSIEGQMFDRMKEIAHYPSIRPASKGWFTSFFGIRRDPFTGKNTDHPGLDISLPEGTPIYATAGGVVKAVNTSYTRNQGYGKYVMIEHGHGIETLYAHLSEIKVKTGQKVDRWDVIGLSGDTGKSTAPHLHYGVFANGQPQNPLHFILN